MIANLIIYTTFLLCPFEVSLADINQLETSDQKTTRIYLIRHGESLFNIPDANGIKYSSGKSLSIPLTEKGELQAKELGNKLIGKFPSDVELLVLSSAAVRAQVTANFVFKLLEPYYNVERGGSFENLCELSLGIWEGKPKDKEYEAALKPWENLSAREKYQFPKISTGESFSDVAQRALEELDLIAKSYPNKTLVITSHNNTMNAIAIELSGGINDLSEEPATSLPSLDLNNCNILLIELKQGASIYDAKVRMHIK